jgi:hypothetical protein
MEENFHHARIAAAIQALHEFLAATHILSYAY